MQNMHSTRLVLQREIAKDNDDQCRAGNFAGVKLFIH